MRPMPNIWEAVPLRVLSTPNRPRHQPKEYAELEFIGMEHIEAHSMRLLNTVPAATMSSSAVHFWPGDVLYGRLRPYLNKVFKAQFEGLCSAEFIVFPASKNLCGSYLQYFLNSAEFVHFASHLNSGDRPRVDFEQLGDYLIPLPPLAEQHRIVAEIEKQLTRLDAAVAALERARANLKRFRASVLNAAIEGRLVIDRDGREGWKDTPVRDSPRYKVESRSSRRERHERIHFRIYESLTSCEDDWTCVRFI